MADQIGELETELVALKERLQIVENERESLLQSIRAVEDRLLEDKKTSRQIMSPEAKIALFRSLFRGREDVYPRLWVSKKTGAKGYSPACENEWEHGVCQKPKIKCGECNNRRFAPVSDEVIRRHLDGQITIGVYPLLPDETCYFLAVDFDKENWIADVSVFLDVCRKRNISAYLERSRSGNGGHVWFFFASPIPSVLARQLGSFLLTEAMDKRHQIDMKSYDRLFPNQDTMPRGGFGNLIALPLQKIPRKSGNSIFLDSEFKPFEDQWGYLANIRRLSLDEVTLIVSEAIRTKDIMGIRTSQTEDDGPPWESPINSRKVFTKLTCDMPKKVSVTLANRLYIRRDSLPSQLLTRIKRIASFQNPEFFKKQSMRFPTALTPRVICCAEDVGVFIAIPRGCTDDLRKLLSMNGVALTIDDKRYIGNPTEFTFNGELSDIQEKAVAELLKNETGVFVAPPGIGKTVLGLKLIAERKVNTLVLVHRKPLLEQWRAQISAFLGLPIKEIGHIGGGKDKTTNIVDVAMIQSLDNKDGVDERIRNYGQIIVDECHHISAVSFERVMMDANAKYITGLTATPYRRDGHQPIIIMQCGPVRYKVTTKSQAINASFNQKLIVRQTGYACQYTDGDPVTTIWPALVNDNSRNQMICDDVLQNLREKLSPIILTERKEHLEQLKERLLPLVKHLVVLHGGMKAPIRREMLLKLAAVPADEERVILATGPYIGEGFDDPRLDTLFLAMPFSFKGKMVQYAGRLHRKYSGKTEVRIYDYVDGLQVLQKMFKKRLKAYSALGYSELGQALVHS